MKQVLTLFSFLLVAGFAEAQISTPAPSPFSTVEQKVGLTDVTIEYSRPGIKGRTVFGDLVPYGKTWRTGANAATKVSFSTDVMIDGKNLAKGTYALYTVPEKDNWTIIFYSDYNQGGVPRDWNEDAVALKFMAAAQQMPVTVENFMINIDALTNSSGRMFLVWENTIVGFDIKVPTDEAVMASIEKVMSGPSDRDYYLAAAYFHDEGKDLNKALKWIDKAIEKGGDRYWVLRKKALIQADLKDYKGAIATAKKSSDAAKEAGNMDYVKMNDQSIAMWKKM